MEAVHEVLITVREELERLCIHPENHIEEQEDWLFVRWMRRLQGKWGPEAPLFRIAFVASGAVATVWAGLIDSFGPQL